MQRLCAFLCQWQHASRMTGIENPKKLVFLFHAYLFHDPACQCYSFLHFPDILFAHFFIDFPICDAALFSASLSATVYAIDAVLFTLSDIVLIFNTFSGVTRFSLRITNLSLYYLGQLLIALSLYFPR